MKPIRSAALLAALFFLGACVPRQAAPPPRAVTPPPVPVVQAIRPLPAPTPPPPVSNLSWADAPLTPGNWSYRPAPQASSASYGPATAPAFMVRCSGAGQILLIRQGATASNSLTFRTSSIARTVNAVTQQEGATATLPASDPLLDALVFSRGRFAVEAQGAMPLVVPAWPELARVVEDCRRGR
jgi:hypothetical protein